MANKITIVILLILTTIALMLTPYSALAQVEETAVKATSVETKATTKTPETPFQKRLKEKTNKTKKALKVGSDVPKTTDMAESFVKGLIYCIVVFVLLSYLNTYVKNKNETSSNKSIDLIARKTIGNRMSLLLVEVEGQKFFLSQTNDMVQMLAPLSDPLRLAESLAQDTEESVSTDIEGYEGPIAVHE